MGFIASLKKTAFFNKFGQLDFMSRVLIETLILIDQADCSSKIPDMTVHVLQKNIASGCLSFPEQNSNFSEGGGQLSYVMVPARRWLVGIKWKVALPSKYLESDALSLARNLLQVSVVKLFSVSELSIVINAYQASVYTFIVATCLSTANVLRNPDPSIVSSPSPK